jgi:hypothetical protein
MSKPIPMVIKIASIRLAAREGGIDVAVVQGSIYESLRSADLLELALYEQQPGQPPARRYRPTARGYKLLYKYEKQQQKKGEKKVA